MCRRKSGEYLSRKMAYQAQCIVCFMVISVVTGGLIAGSHEEINDDLAIELRGAATPIGELSEAALKAHNFVRQNHDSTPSLVWDDGLAEEAQSYALHLANTGTFEHSSSKKGENLYEGTSGKVMGFEIAAFLWYDEIRLFDYSKIWKINLYGPQGAGHFTQMVWASTHKVGCAGAQKPWMNGMIKTVYACRYSPAGNVPGLFDENVRPLKSGASIPTNPMQFLNKPNGGGSAVANCQDKNAGYCSRLTQSSCNDPAFGTFNQHACPKTCKKC